MFKRYSLTVTNEENFIYEKYFKSLNQAISAACGFDSSCTLFLYDSLFDTVYSKSLVDQLVKEFQND